MSHHLPVIAKAIALAALVATPTGAQHPNPGSNTPDPQAETRSPTGAALLSLFYPGSGSYYAGNVGHGTRHAVLGITLSAAWTTGLIAACNDGYCSDGAGELVLFGGLGVIALHRIWAMIDAVGDAHAHNRGRGRQSRVEVRPEPVVLSSSRDPATHMPDLPAASLGIQVARLRF